MLAVITKPNPHLRVGQWIECFDDGCRKVNVETVNNRLRVVSEEGIILPREVLAPFMMRTLKRGLDK